MNEYQSLSRGKRKCSEGLFTQSLACYFVKNPSFCSSFQKCIHSFVHSFVHLFHCLWHKKKQQKRPIRLLGKIINPPFVVVGNVAKSPYLEILFHGAGQRSRRASKHESAVFPGQKATRFITTLSIFFLQKSPAFSSESRFILSFSFCFPPQRKKPKQFLI